MYYIGLDDTQRLHNAGYFRELLATSPDIDEGLRVPLRPCRETMGRLSQAGFCYSIRGVVRRRAQASGHKPTANAGVGR